MTSRSVTFKIDEATVQEFKDRLGAAGGSTGMSETIRAAIHNVIDMDQKEFSSFLRAGKIAEVNHDFESST
jgi:hypothetical protein